LTTLNIYNYLQQQWYLPAKKCSNDNSIRQVTFKENLHFTMWIYTKVYNW